MYKFINHLVVPDFVTPQSEAVKPFLQVRNDIGAVLNAVESVVDGLEAIASLDGMSLESVFAIAFIPMPVTQTCRRNG